MGRRSDWENVRPLGGGGQSNVFLVRRPERAKERSERIQEILLSNPWAPPDVNLRPDAARERISRLTQAANSYSRADAPHELAALKIFKIPQLTAGKVLSPRNIEAIKRLNGEVAVLRQGRSGLPRLLDFNEDERWIVTEYFPKGTLADNRVKYKGKPLPALKAFRSLVQTVASLHREKMVHRDIKPANVFLREDDELVLGDFGIVYIPDQSVRVTMTEERVGPRECMPQWADLGTRLEKVQPNFDVYMLGKLLWSMLDGRAVLPREYHGENKFNLCFSFPDMPEMEFINRILDRCIVERPGKCLESACELLSMVETGLKMMERGGQLLSPGIVRPCHVCGLGFYEPDHMRDRGSLRFGRRPNETDMEVAVFICDRCGHVELFLEAVHEVNRYGIATLDESGRVTYSARRKNAKRG